MRWRLRVREYLRKLSIRVNQENLLSNRPQGLSNTTPKYFRTGLRCRGCRSPRMVSLAATDRHLERSMLRGAVYGLRTLARVQDSFRALSHRRTRNAGKPTGDRTNRPSERTGFCGRRCARPEYAGGNTLHTPSAGCIFGPDEEVTPD
jgi:hypothetical protein